MGKWGRKMKHILVVDDDIMSLGMIRDALSTQYQIAAVTSGEKALIKLEENVPDLILLGIEMPGTEGKELAEMIKEDKRWENVPIVFLAPDFNPMTEEKCLLMGAEDFIVKPIVSMVLKRRIGRILEVNDLRKVLEAHAEQTETMKNAMLQEDVMDELTGVFKGECVAQKINALIKSGNKGTLFVVKVSNLIEIKDNFAQETVNCILKLLAKTLTENTRKMDVVGRWTDEEMIVFFPGMLDDEIAKNKMEKVLDTYKQQCAKECKINRDAVELFVSKAVCFDSSCDFDGLYARRENF